MNEIDLIREVERRPILYDKTVSGFNKTRLRDNAWKDVQETLNVSEAECKKRWRSLRDSFIKLQRTHGGRTRWPYLSAMRFLLPHIETTKTETPAREINIKREASDSEPEEAPKRPAPDFSLPDLSFPDFRSEEDEEDSQSSKKMRLDALEELDPCHCNRTDPDELFLLSCAPTLKRLNAKQHAVARLKIQQVLYEAEFGSQIEPLESPAPDSGYENMDGAVEIS
ncbi:transcription factor Adf-1-like [Pararge aegeria]|uniref:Jg16138 protein n=1 Tax=Pararge aegeria aegeria TaxID=348720 RepID=A0A8S4REJ1_9NEOP|nr:transcription factor Adf-1-like [Pararge aegeria]CAH2235147.1 jg16138 [Pararge aegeria aegeria]